MFLINQLGDMNNAANDPFVNISQSTQNVSTKKPVPKYLIKTGDGKIFSGITIKIKC